MVEFLIFYVQNFKKDSFCDKMDMYFRFKGQRGALVPIFLFFSAWRNL